MTPAEKARETRKVHAEAQKAKERERIEIREKMKKTCLNVVDDPSASSADKMDAIRILHALIKGR